MIDFMIGSPQFCWQKCVMRSTLGLVKGIQSQTVQPPQTCVKIVHLRLTLAGSSLDMCF